MLETLWNELATGWIWAAIPVVSYTLFRLWSRQFRKRYRKFTLYKVTHLRLKSSGSDPVYVRQNHTLEDHQEEVYDEVWMVNSSFCNYETEMKPIEMSSSGMVDAYQIAPVFGLSADIRPHSADDPKRFVYSHSEKTDRIATAGVLVNGLQTPRNWFFATQAQYNNQDITLVADFSSIPNTQSIHSRVHGVIETVDQGSSGKSAKACAVDRIGEDIYSISAKDCRAGDVLKIEFDLDVEKLKA